MPVELGSAYGKVAIDTTGVNAGVREAEQSMDGMARSMDQIGESMRNAGTKLTVGVTAPLAALGTLSVNAASDLDESMNKVNVVFGESADELTAWSDTADEAFGQRQQQALEAVGTFGNLFICANAQELPLGRAHPFLAD